ncbi:MAG TPA: hypothetical protein VKI64_06910, partial [Acidimicrobiales bacterium]|nr:hypothetical protein [Acidimicrobiales bacterium]
MRARQLPTSAVALALCVALAGCSGSSGSGGSGGSSHSPVTVRSIRSGATSYSMAEAQSSIAVGTSRFVFGLIPRSGAPAAGGSVQVWVAADERSAASGPFPARFVAWSAPRTDAFGHPPVPGFYEADVTVPRPGNWLVAARGVVGGRLLAGVGATAA